MKQFLESKSRNTKEDKKFQQRKISQLLLGTEPIWSVDNTYIYSVIHCDSISLKSSRNWEDLEQLEGKEYEPNLLFERNNGT